MRDNAATWLEAFVWVETGAAIILAAGLFLVLGIAAYCIHRGIRWAAGRARHRLDIRRMNRRPRPKQAGTDNALLLDCRAIAGDLLRDRSTETREGEK